MLDDPELHARSAQDTVAVLLQAPRPIPALSYASERLFEEMALWRDAVCPILARHVRLLAAQVDNETAFFLAAGPLEALADALEAWVDARHPPCAFSLVVERADAQPLLERPDTLAGLRELLAAGRLGTGPLPEPLAGALGAARSP